VINDILNMVVQKINELSAGNQMIAGAISLWLLGVASYVFRSIPQRIYWFFWKQLTTEFVVTSQNTSFYNLLDWFRDGGHAGKVRRLKVWDGRFGWGDKTTKSIGYGSHLLWHGWIPLFVSLSRETSNDSYDKEMITIVKLGRSHKVFDKLLENIAIERRARNMLEVFSSVGDHWEIACKQPFRGFDSVIVDDEVLGKMRNAVDNFISAEDWYVKNGIPYSLGILLYGPPGTGKTSVIRALASHLKRDIYAIPVSKVMFYPQILQRVSSDGILVVEDVDACSSACARAVERVPEPGPVEEVKPGVDKPNTPVVRHRPRGSDLADEYNAAIVNTSDLLNAIDGLATSHGRILVMTTNHPEKLDPALLRPGRCDVRVEIGYFSEKMFIRFFERFFPGFSEKMSGRVIADNLTGAVLQQAVLEKKTPDEIILESTKEIPR